MPDEPFDARVTSARAFGEHVVFGINVKIVIFYLTLSILMTLTFSDITGEKKRFSSMTSVT